MNRNALEGNGDKESGSMADHPSNSDFREEAELLVEENAKVEEEDGEFCEVLNKNVENLRNIVELIWVSARCERVCDVKHTSRS